MKAMIVVLSPEECCNLLNGDLSVLVRKKFPKDYVGWVYIYVTKGKPFLFQEITYEALAPCPHLVKHPFKTSNYCPEPDTALNGRVVAKFTLNEVKEIFTHINKQNNDYWYHLDTKPPVEGCIQNLCKKSCLKEEELHSYLKGKKGYAWHIDNIVQFDKPKEISEFSHYDNSQYQALPNGEQYRGVLEPLTCAPRSGWCYVEV